MNDIQEISLGNSLNESNREEIIKWEVAMHLNEWVPSEKIISWFSWVHKDIAIKVIGVLENNEK